MGRGNKLGSARRLPLRAGEGPPGARAGAGAGAPWARVLAVAGLLLAVTLANLALHRGRPGGGDGGAQAGAQAGAAAAGDGEPPGGGRAGPPGGGGGGAGANGLAGPGKRAAKRKGYNSGIETGARLKDKLKGHLDFRAGSADRDLAGLWGGPDLFKYPDGSRIPAQAWRHCKTLFLAASSTTGKGVVVEFGSWIGQSSRCLGAGMNTTGYRGHLFSYDSYNNAINHQKLAGTKYEKMKFKDFRFIWRETVLPVYPSGRSVMGRIDKDHFDADLWPKKLVEVFAIDSAKTHRHFLDQAGLVWRYLAVGSVLCMMDFAKTPQVEVFYAEFVADGSLELVSLDFCASPWTFIVKKPLYWSRVKNFKPWNRSEDQWAEIFKGVNRDIDRIARLYHMKSESEIDCVKRLIKKRKDLVMQWTRNHNSNWAKSDSAEG